MANIKISEQAITFLQRFQTICVAGCINDPKAPEQLRGKWLGAIIHAETHKLIIQTPPVFKKKADAILFMEDLRAKAKKELVIPGQVISLN